MALAKVLELRRQGWSYRQIGRYAEHSGHAHPRPPFAAPTLFGSSPASTIDAKVFLRSLDAVEHGIAFYTPTGDLLHANRTFLRLLRPDPPEPRIELELMMFAPSIAAIAQVRSGGCVTSLMEGISTQRILVGTDLVNIRGSYVGFDLFSRGESVVAMTLEALLEPLSDDLLRARFSLSRQESRIARMLVEGASNAVIAERLFISPHTARHHTQQVLRKLDVNSRAGVAMKILRGARPAH